MASASFDGTVRLWQQFQSDTPTVEALRSHVGPVNDVASHPDGDLGASVGEDHTLRLWQTDGTLLASREAHRDGAFGVAF